MCDLLWCSQEEGGKAAQEAAIEAALAEHNIDVIVLARYMQVSILATTASHACARCSAAALPLFDV